MTPQPETPLEYRAYLLKLWRELNGEESWRFSLEKIGGKCDRRGFPSLDALVEFLERQMAAGDSISLDGEPGED